MSDDLREREPIREQGDNPPHDGVRTDHAGSSEGPTPVAPGGDSVERAQDRMTGDGGGDRPKDPLANVEHPTADH
jgi:hypothetical protein